MTTHSTAATLLLAAAFTAAPANAQDFSDDPQAPTVLTLSPGSNPVAGDVGFSNAVDGDRDFLTFTVGPGQSVDEITITQWDPDNRGFIAINAGDTGFIPSGATNASFLAGILPETSNVGSNLLDLFVTNSITAFELDEPTLGPGEYTLVIQQTSSLTQLYALDIVLTAEPPSPRQIQISGIDFENGLITLTNLGSQPQDVTGWRFCSHDFDQARRYTGSSGLNGVTIDAGATLTIHFNNDAPGGDATAINRSSLGGSFATPLDVSAYALQLFNPAANGSVSFGNSSLIADHIQWNIAGASAGSAETRTGQAVSQGLWSANGDFIATRPDTTTIALIDLSGDEAGAPSEYVIAPLPCNAADLDANGTNDLIDAFAFLDAYNPADPSDLADLNGDGENDLVDAFAFLDVYDPEFCAGG